MHIVTKMDMAMAWGAREAGAKVGESVFLSHIYQKLNLDPDPEKLGKTYTMKPEDEQILMLLDLDHYSVLPN